MGGGKELAYLIVGPGQVTGPYSPQEVFLLP